MTYRQSRRLIGAAALLCAAAAPVAEAHERDTGVGREIAEQGNIALRLIRAQARIDMLYAEPSRADVHGRSALQVAAHRRASGTGTTFGSTTTVRAAE